MLLYGFWHDGFEPPLPISRLFQNSHGRPAGAICALRQEPRAALTTSLAAGRWKWRSRSWPVAARRRVKGGVGLPEWGDGGELKGFFHGCAQFGVHPQFAG